MERLGEHGESERKSERVYVNTGSNATRWPDYLLNIWPFSTIKIAL